MRIFFCHHFQVVSHANYYIIPNQALASGSYAFAPPRKYTGETKVKIQVLTSSLKDIQKHCKNKLYPIIVYGGCSINYESGHCTIFIPNKPIPNLSWPIGGVFVLTPEMILKHEKAHCNGWTASHPK